LTLTDLAADVDQLGADRSHLVLAITVGKGGRRRLVPLAPCTPAPWLST
jgi:hypothetical protein